MPVSCSAYGCTNRQKKDSGVHFFRFALSRRKLVKSWITAVRRKKFVPTKCSRICGVHFKDTDYIEGNSYKKKMLKPDVVPSIFPEFPNHLQSKVKKPRSLFHYRDITNHETDHNNRDIGTQTDRLMNSNGGICQYLAETEAAGQDFEAKFKRKNSCITNLKDVLKVLRNEKVVNEDFESFILSHFHGVSASIFLNEWKNGKNDNKHATRYTEEIKKFALIMHYNSSKAYSVLRQHLSLSHPDRITT